MVCASGVLSCGNRDDANRSNARPREAGINAGFAALASAIANAEEDDCDEEEPEEDESEPPPVIIPRRSEPTLVSAEETPHWWNEATIRQCKNPDCGKVIPPRRLPNGKWEAMSQYAILRNCSIDCAQARYRKKG